MKPTKFTSTIFLVVLSLLISCETEDDIQDNEPEYIEYTIDDEDSVLITENISATYNPNELYIRDQDNCFTLYGFLPDPYNLGEYDTYIVTGEAPINTGFFITRPCLMGITNLQDIVFTLNNWGEPGEYIDVNFSGTFLNGDLNQHSITGALHVLRDE
ncbi:hypothetical protein H8K90_13700 [Winogradskyella echinorum]|uniref:Lipoprotein n=1 Tax=Winogradskyella echinorum TaxID=538189 RepID=A0ABR6Y5D7_9FLAO|nr:hypothetical protein [Winogradskyella echinorum]MBC3847445.1 hypothetical protein [Winogradskyella echinorum]MBC5751793.1 hypothetical protein [Winogradskyella echinorum]